MIEFFKEALGKFLCREFILPLIGIISADVALSKHWCTFTEWAPWALSFVTAGIVGLGSAKLIQLKADKQENAENVTPPTPQP